MIAIADGGATKTDWRFIDEGGLRHSSSTIGFNPFYVSTPAVVSELNQYFVKTAPVQSTHKLYYYGSGCSEASRQAILSEAFQSIFPRARIEISDDLLGCARATCRTSSGIACILGTGSNSCLYDGEKIIDQVTNLGFYLGDEGSGSHLGKALIKAYFYREIPEELAKDFERKYSPKRKDLLDHIYGDKPNVYLASFSKFLAEHLEQPFSKKLVLHCFGEFLDRHVCKYQGCNELPIHFVGSIAHYFLSPLKLALQARQLKLGSIIQKPIKDLVEFHLKHDFGLS